VTTFIRKSAIVFIAAAFTLVGLTQRAPARADEPGLSADEIVIGGDHPYSGPASAYGSIGKGIGVFFEYVNDHGGVNGRKIKWIDRDDGYSPPQAVQVVHQLVEQDNVFALFNSLGTQVNIAIRGYLNDNKVPQLFVSTGATTFGADYKQYPWTMGWQPNYQAEAIIYAQDILSNHPKAKIGVLYQNDDFGQDLMTGLKTGLGSHGDLIVKTASYETTDTSVSSQISELKSAGCDTLMIFATPKFAIQAMVAKAQQSWTPLTYLNNVANTIPYMRAAAKIGGPSAVSGIVTTFYLKDPANHARYAGDAGMKLYRDMVAKYLPGTDQDDGNLLYGAAVAFTFVDCLRRAGRDITRQKLVDAAIHLNERDNPFVYPGIVINTNPSYRFPISQLITAKWLDTDWSPQGVLIDAKPFTAAAH
jgi:branched-chain amino acid transport system substrate-binding protein